MTLSSYHEWDKTNNKWVIKRSSWSKTNLFPKKYTLCINTDTPEKEYKHVENEPKK